MNNEFYMKLVKEDISLNLLKHPFVLLNDLGIYANDQNSIEDALSKNKWIGKTNLGAKLKQKIINKNNLIADTI